MDIDALVKRKNELVDLRDDEDHEFEDYEQEELDELLVLESDMGCTLEEAMRNGAIFIDENYFEDYAQELAEDLGLINDNVYSWPYNHIDWNDAARDLAMDYSEVEFQGNTYLVRI